MSATQATKNQYNSVDKDRFLLDILICPACSNSNSTLVIDSGSASCTQCGSHFPIFKCADKEIPWLYKEPESQVYEWQARLKGFMHINELEQQHLKEGLKDKRLSKTGQKRIRKLFDSKKQQREQVLSLLAPFNLQNSESVSINLVGKIQNNTPRVQGLTSYYDNIFRDWSWSNYENQQMLDAINRVYDAHNSIGKILTIGSGAGRLSYDIHKKYSADYSLLLDINPLLMSAACNAIQGNCFDLNEFPIAPLNKQTFYATQSCGAPLAIKENIDYLFADGMNPPVNEGAFDTVLTPWLLDIIPQNLRDYIPRINRCIREGGIWLNTGSLAFFHKQASWCYSEEEVIELIEKNGFELIAANRNTISYLKSPLSAHGRTEDVFSFCARKIKNVVQPKKYEYLPTWIRNTTESIPKQLNYEIGSSKHLLQAQVFGAIDGNRSIEQIGGLVAKQYNLEVTESITAVRQIMIDSFEEH
ncbi:MAG: Trm112 family protein [Pseudomonadota bacterium]